MDQGDVDIEPLGDLADAVVEDGVAGDPEHPVLLALPGQREADDLADDRVAERRPVAAGRRRDLDRGPPVGLEPGAFPGGEAAGVAAEPLRPGDGRDDGPGAGQQLPPGPVEVVVVVVMAEQDRVDPPQIGGGDRRSGELLRAGPPAEPVAAAGGVEGRVGQQPPATRPRSAPSAHRCG